MTYRAYKNGQAYTDFDSGNPSSVWAAIRKYYGVLPPERREKPRAEYYSTATLRLWGWEVNKLKSASQPAENKHDWLEELADQGVEVAKKEGPGLIMRLLGKLIGR